MDIKRTMEYLEMLIELEAYIEAVEEVRRRINHDISYAIKAETRARNKELRKQFNSNPIEPREPFPSSYSVRSVNEGWFPWQRAQIKRENKENKDAAEKEYSKKMQIYRQELAAYNEEIARKEAYENMLTQQYKESQRRTDAITKIVENYLDNKIDEARNLQVMAGQQRIIHPIYVDDMEALCYFYKCLDIGWTDELRGENGAYSRWEAEKHNIAVEGTLSSMSRELKDIHYTLKDMKYLQEESLQRQDKFYQSLMTIETKKQESINALCDMSVKFCREFNRQQSMTLSILNGIWIDTGLTAINTNFSRFNI